MKEGALLCELVNLKVIKDQQGFACVHSAILYG